MRQVDAEPCRLWCAANQRPWPCQIDCAPDTGDSTHACPTCASPGCPPRRTRPAIGCCVLPLADMLKHRGCGSCRSLRGANPPSSRCYLARDIKPLRRTRYPTWVVPFFLLSFWEFIRANLLYLKRNVGPFCLPSAAIHWIRHPTKQDDDGLVNKGLVYAVVFFGLFYVVTVYILFLCPFISLSA